MDEDFADRPADAFTHARLDGTALHVHRWLPPTDVPVRAVVQIAHGMVEHGGRYAEFGGAAAKEGYAVYASDHRGHGWTAASQDELGHLGDEHGFADVVDDLVALTAYLRGVHPHLPVVLLGHSMGSMMARAYAVRHGEQIDGLIVMGTAGDPGVKGRVGLLLARAEAALRGPSTPSRLLQELTFGPYNTAFAPTRTDFDWLSRDPEEVDAYLADERCGVLASAGLYRDLLTGLRWVSHPATLRTMPRELPVLITSGEFDPVGGASAVTAVADLMRQAGMRQVDTRVWPGARHELLHETNRQDVIADLISWIGTNVAPTTTKP